MVLPVLLHCAPRLLSPPLLSSPLFSSSLSAARRGAQSDGESGKSRSSATKTQRAFVKMSNIQAEDKVSGRVFDSAFHADTCQMVLGSFTRGYGRSSFLGVWFVVSARLTVQRGSPDREKEVESKVRKGGGTVVCKLLHCASTHSQLCSWSALVGRKVEGCSSVTVTAVMLPTQGDLRSTSCVQDCLPPPTHTEKVFQKFFTC
ncbi:hypothetical protein Q8A73_001240 [Channa argus]|nr:hypothetical protein Q8A73_001240 [Channa argus]